jgi:hypothetical protein
MKRTLIYPMLMLAFILGLMPTVALCDHDEGRRREAECREEYNHEVRRIKKEFHNRHERRPQLEEAKRRLNECMERAHHHGR